MKDNDIGNICSTNGIDKARFYREISMEEGNWGKTGSRLGIILKLIFRHIV